MNISNDQNNDNNKHDYFVLFEVGGTTYGVRALMVQQMEMLDRITRVPNTIEFVEGVVFSRGQVIPAINLRLRFGLEKIPYDSRTRLLVIKTEDRGDLAGLRNADGRLESGRTVGLIADTAREFVSIPLDAVQKPSEGLLATTNCLAGIARLGDRTVLILNMEELLNSHEWQQQVGS
ncbi:MAG TPA: chemotaxis protein CheW [Oscillatoriaceae cyanobacterium M33_DOE_052]|uniref:Chemotaxis protein CheW n=1 Tax=Planktothricoides sp. SpSt-374 TaxID=2282167 RepID=A0A7C3VHR9_9CYAN|nr:chemotaxis protein CheW [Oscillatoriaceae cyanobacterium M33_DOE_052]